LNLVKSFLKVSNLAYDVVGGDIIVVTSRDRLIFAL